MRSRLNTNCYNSAFGVTASQLTIELLAHSMKALELCTTFNICVLVASSSGRPCQSCSSSFT
jgi:hypothetical protein